MSGFIGIAREPVFSPGKVEDDRAILDTVADYLRRQGHSVDVCTATDEGWPEPGRDTTVFTMAQGALALQRLEQWEARGVRIINSPLGILNCQRHRTVAALARSEVAFPDTLLVDTAVVPTFPSWVDDGGAWIKRGDVHATEADDVVRVTDVENAAEALRRFHLRGVDRAVVQRHVAGTVLKFYAVRGRFFYCVPPDDGTEIPAEALRRIDALGQGAARALDVEVYGGDCVYGAGGALTLIDLNDWPSYARCRAGAAKEIAAYLLAQDVTQT